MVKQAQHHGVGVLAAALFVLSMAATIAASAQQSVAAGDQPRSAQSASSSNASSSDETAKKRLLFLLSMYHGEPTREQLDEAGSPTHIAALLRQIAADKTARPSMRLRAVDSLGQYSDDVSVEFLERAIATPSMLEVQRPDHAQLLRQHAMLSFVRIRGQKAVATLVPFVEAGDVQLRLTAVSALGRFGGRAGLAELERLLTQVEHPVVKRALNKFVEPSSKGSGQ